MPRGRSPSTTSSPSPTCSPSAASPWPYTSPHSGLLRLLRYPLRPAVEVSSNPRTGHKGQHSLPLDLHRRPPPAHHKFPRNRPQERQGTACRQHAPSPHEARGGRGVSHIRMHVGQSRQEGRGSGVHIRTVLGSQSTVVSMQSLSSYKKSDVSNE